jgi:glycerate 2-kinase
MMIDCKGRIRNQKELIGAGMTAHLRKMALDIIEHSLLAADPYAAVKRMVCLEGDELLIGKQRFDLAGFERIIVLGAGKASFPIAQALEDILGDRISDGVLILKHGDEASLNHIRVMYGNHPVPDEGGFRGAKAMLALAQSCTEKDLVIAGITGGSSALMPYPVPGVTLADKQRVNHLLLHSGADITQINAVRKHLSQIKGGWLAKHILPATLINLTVSDVVGDMLDYITDPTVPDTSTFGDARKVLDDFDLWDKFPASASAYLRNGGCEQETPKLFDGAPLYTYVVVDGAAASRGALARADELGFAPMILTTFLKGEAREAGMLFAAIALEIASHGRPLKPPCAIIAAGENTVTINGKYGKGGPNQEFVVSACSDIAGLDNVVIVAIDTDGTDGPTDLMGGIVDGSTYKQAQDQGIDIALALKHHDVSPLLDSLGAGIFTGPTGTNVNDLKLVLVG